jgi:hypothetical protein
LPGAIKPGSTRRSGEANESEPLMMSKPEVRRASGISPGAGLKAAERRPHPQSLVACFSPFRLRDSPAPSGSTVQLAGLRKAAKRTLDAIWNRLGEFLDTARMRQLAPSRRTSNQT